MTKFAPYTDGQDFKIMKSDGTHLATISPAGYITPAPQFKNFREALRNGLRDPVSHGLCQCLIKLFSVPSNTDKNDKP